LRRSPSPLAAWILAYPISLVFLLIGVIDTVLLFAWEHIFHRIEL
jgi:hypothetical protein